MLQEKQEYSLVSCLLSHCVPLRLFSVQVLPTSLLSGAESAWHTVGFWVVVFPYILGIQL